MAAATTMRSNASEPGGLTFALQALLSRHESYMASSTLEREAMSTQIASLESQKRALESANISLVAENRSLLDTLEATNQTIANSETHIASLTSTLTDTQHEMRRLTALAAKTAELESQLLAMEQGTIRLQNEVAAAHDEE